MNKKKKNTFPVICDIYMKENCSDLTIGSIYVTQY